VGCNEDVDINDVVKFVLKSIGVPNEIEMKSLLEHLIQEENARKEQYGEDLIYYSIRVTLLYIIYKQLKKRDCDEETMKPILTQVSESWKILLGKLDE
tara:strand:- start:264 stop:557 length:294 start_codon:yes stop_codon:yes gene_type:complete